MKRIALLATAALWLAVGSPVQGSLKGADWSHPRVISTAGLAVAYARGWHANTEAGPSLVISSFPLPRDWWAETRKRIPAGGVYVWTYATRPVSNGDPFPARPDHFALRDEDRRQISCGVGLVGWNVIFVDRGRVVQAIVGLGEDARKDDATELLDRLVVEPRAS